MALSALTGGMLIVLLAPAQLDWNREVWCIEDRDGKRLRAQCDERAAGGPACLVAPDFLEGGGELRQLRDCLNLGKDGYENLVQTGFRQIPAVAESPPGWMRDARGRVFQVTFDMLDRFFLGAAWLPTFGLDDGADSGAAAAVNRVRFDMGFSASLLDPEERSRHTFRAVEGSVALGGLEANGLLFAYDYSHHSRRPFLWITTFFGTPARHDLFLDVGAGVRLAGIRLHPHGSLLTHVEWAEVHSAWDIWQSQDLSNRLRLETGFGVGELFGRGDVDVSVLIPNASLIGRFVLDGDGFHTLEARASLAKPIAVSGVTPGTDWTRAGAAVSYELILLAVNDQPLSLRLEAGLDYRDDLGPGARVVEATAAAGLRFSFWAPALVHPVMP